MQVEKLYQLFKSSSGISTDTRSVKPGNLFFALKGDRFNGNLFAKQALNAGAAHVIADEKHFEDRPEIILVENVLVTLQQLANYYRAQLQTKIIAVCGSNGKTTTKELIARVLETSFKTFFTQGNLNNHIGVPLSLLSIEADTEFAVIEMGANHLGETKLLCEIAEPDFGLITNNGKDHLEGYGGIEGVRKGNGELYDFLRAKNRTAFVSADQNDLMQMSEGLNRYTYGENKTTNCMGEISELFPFLQIKLTSFNLQLTTQLIGKYNFENLMAAVSVGKYFGVADEKIKQAIESYAPSNNRSQILKRGTNTFILDAYNANPSSMEAALDNFFSIPAENKMVILGDMAELGTASNDEHKAIIMKLKNADCKIAVLAGNEFRKADLENTFLHFNNVGELKEWFSKQHFENYFFLLKASRVVQLEKLLGQ